MTSLLVLVFLAGAVGAVARDAVARGWQRAVPSRPRDGVALVNVVGALALGALVGAHTSQRIDDAALVVLGGGLLGGFTTFSTWLVAAHDVGWRAVARDVALHLVPGAAAAGLGLLLGG